MSPNGARHAMSPVLRSMATTSPYGGFTSGRPRAPPRPARPLEAAAVPGGAGAAAVAAPDAGGAIDAGGGTNVAFPCAPANSASLSPGRLLACGPGTIRRTAGELLILTYSRPVAGSNADPPQLAPPMTPGRVNVPSTDGGV